MNKKLFLFAILFVTLAIAGYLYYPEIERGTQEGESLGRGLGPTLEKTPPTIYTATLTTTIPESKVQYTPELPLTDTMMGREISITVSISLEVDDVRGKARDIMNLAYSLGGYVQHSSISGDKGFLTIKVPRGNLESALSGIRSMGTVIVEEMDTVDLTDAIVDLEARLRNARAEEERLLELLKKATDVRDILEIESRISAVRESIERLEAMRENMKRRVDYATISVSILKRGVPASEERSFLDKIGRDATRALLGSIYIIVVGGAFLAVPLTVVLLIWFAYKKGYSKIQGGR